MNTLRTWSLPLSLVLASATFVGGCGDSSSAEDDSATQEAAVGEGARTPVETFTSLSFDGHDLTFAYQIGGGCAEHEPKARAELVTHPTELAAKVTVADVASNEDLCDAILSPQGKVNVRALLAEAVSERSGFDDPTGRDFMVTLPSLGIDVGHATDAPAPLVGDRIGAVSTLSVDQRTGVLRYGYVVPGGCGEHTASTAVEFEAGSRGSYRAKIVVSDVTPGDMCESFVGVEGTVDLRSLLANESVRAGLELSGRRVVVELPAIRVSY